MLAGSGGTMVEALDDASVRPIPITADDAAEMLAETRVAQVLARPRAMPPPPLGALHDLIVRLSAGSAGSRRSSRRSTSTRFAWARRACRILDARVVLAS